MPKFMAVFTGAPGDKTTVAQDDIARSMKAWGDWMARHAEQVVDTGGPLGGTKKVSDSGIADIRNNIAGYVVVEAADHDAAARMFEGHPHFTIFPGDGVEVMPLLPIPGMPE